MAFTVTAASRRLAMTVLLALAVSGGVIRHLAPPESTLHDIGTLLLVMWIPAVGNLIGWVARKIPYGPPPPLAFPAGSTFTPHLQARIEAGPLPDGLAGAIAGQDLMCTAIAGRRGFSLRFAKPLSDVLATPVPQDLELELLRPASALPHLVPGAEFHLAVGNQAVAKGQVLAVLSATVAADPSVKPT